MTDVSNPRVVPRNIARSWLAGALTAIVAMGIPVATPHVASAQTRPPLGAAEEFAVLAATTVTNTPLGATVVVGDLGVVSGTPPTNFPPGTVVGDTHPPGTGAAAAQASLLTAYNFAAAQGPATIVGTELGGTVLPPGVYASDAGDFQITGNLRLDAQGDPNAVFIFQMASTLVTAVGSTVTLENGAQACNVFWRVGSSATLGVGSRFAGNILAQTSIGANTGAIVDGRLLALDGAVTLDANLVRRADCAGVPPSPTASSIASSIASATPPGSRGKASMKQKKRGRQQGRSTSDVDVAVKTEAPRCRRRHHCG
ncbi:ice-binding family protein [Nonomuraea sp. H19]|uniref:ice-binding family protein n=1 Tax=Nonomuraea sp. H19 TaxID=3452206 RepID=UPI003F8B4BCC